MTNTKRVFFDIIASVFDESAKARLPKAASEDALTAIYNISSKHDVAHIAAKGLEDANLLPAGEVKKLFAKQKLAAIFRREQINAEEAVICALLEENEIDHIPLKGAVIRKLYPEEWLRQSCDIDILVKEADLEKAILLIKEKLGYGDEGRNYHEHSLISKNGVHLELHFSIAENDPDSDVILERAWEYAVSNGSRRHTFTNEFLMFQMIAHAKFHFTSGGCGIRQILDLWILKNRLKYDAITLEKLLDESKIRGFYNGIESLVDVWFGEREYTTLTSDMEKYILSGGAFGTFENKALAGRHKSGGKNKYFLSRIFMSKSELEIAYPKLKKTPILLPYYEVKRWFGLMNKKGLSNARGEFSANNENTFEDMFSKLGL